MNQFKQWLADQGITSGDAITSIALTIIFILVLLSIRWVILKAVFRQTANVNIRYRWQKTTSYVIFFIGLFLIGGAWSDGLKELTTFLGLIAAGIALALKDGLMNLAGWAFILWRHPIRVGDRIEMGEHAGDVIDQRLFQFTILEIGKWVDADQSTGRVIHIPNGHVFTKAIANFTQGFQYLWIEIPVTITFESDWREAKNVLTEVAARHGRTFSKAAEKRIKEASRKSMISYAKLTPIVYTSVKQEGVCLTIRCLAAPRRRRGIEQAIWEDILDQFHDHENIHLAYPTTRFVQFGTRANNDPPSA